MITIPGLQDHQTLRYVEIDGGYRLHTWDTYSTDRGMSRLGYAFYRPNTTEPLFLCDQFFCPPNLAIDSDSVLRTMMNFITLRRGDTDKAYFQDYTEDQWSFVDQEAEDLQYWGFSESTCKDFEMTPLVFRDLEMN